jgi:hypothetical protein
MKLVVLIAIALGVAFFYPARHEQTQTACAALEKRVVALLPPAQAKLLPPNANPQARIHGMIPFLPPQAGCAVAYWLTIAKPDLIEPLAGGLFVKP